MTAFQEQLLDSAYRYELLKPTFFNLKTAYESRGKEVDDLRNALRMSDLQRELQKKEIARSAKESSKRERKKLRVGLSIGGVIGILIATIAH